MMIRARITNAERARGRYGGVTVGSTYRVVGFETPADFSDTCWLVLAPDAQASANDGKAAASTTADAVSEKDLS